jgi:hypothetical protein
MENEFSDGEWSGRLSTDTRSVELADIRSIWYRDPAAFRFTDALSDVERAHAHLEARLGLGGVLAALPVLWVNNPNRAADAMYKPVQLATAAACGLVVPDTLVTNRPAAVSRFAERMLDGVVGKTFGANTVTEDGALKVSYTYRLDENDFHDLRCISATAHQIQHWVDKKYEARVVVVGDQKFGVTIHAHSASTHVDWRTDFDALTYELTELPDSAGQYGWLEDATGAPISSALIDLLVSGNRE